MAGLNDFKTLSDGEVATNQPTLEEHVSLTQGEASTNQHTPDELTIVSVNQTESQPNRNSSKQNGGCDGGIRGWVIVMAASMIHAIFAGFIISQGVLYVSWQEEFSEGAARVSWVGSAILFAGLSVGGPIAGAMSKRFSCRALVIAGGALSCLSISLVQLTTSLTELICVLFIAGIGLGIAYLPTTFIIKYNFEKRLALAYGVTYAGIGVGTIAMPPLMQLFADTYGWRGAMLIFAGIIGNVSVMGMLFRPSNRERKQMTGSKRNQKTESSEFKPHGQDESRDEVVSTRNCADPTADTIKSNLDSNIALTGIKEATRDVDGDDIYSNDGNVEEEFRVELKSQDPKDARNPKESGEHDNQGLDLSPETFTSLQSSSQDHLPPQTCHPANPTADTKNPKPMSEHFWCTVLLKNIAKNLCLDLLVTNFRFLGVCLVYLITGVAYYASLVFIVPRATSIGIPQIEAVIIPSFNGIFSTVGRLANGPFVDAKIITPIKLCTFAMLLNTLSCLFCPLTQSFATMCIFAAALGISNGLYMPLFAMLITQYVDTDKIGGALSLGQFFLGVGGFAGAYLVGGLYDITGSYDASYYTTGIASGVAFFILLCEPLLMRLQVRFDIWRSVEGNDLESRDCKDSVGQDSGLIVPHGSPINNNYLATLPP